MSETCFYKKHEFGVNHVDSMSWETFDSSNETIVKLLFVANISRGCRTDIWK